MLQCIDHLSKVEDVVDEMVVVVWNSPTNAMDESAIKEIKVGRWGVRGEGGHIDTYSTY